MQLDFEKMQSAFLDEVIYPSTNGTAFSNSHIYAKLLRHNYNALISPTYPITQTVLSKARWKEMLETFFQTARQSSPYFHHLAGEFLTFWQMRSDAFKDLPFVLELMQFEWLELYLECIDVPPTAVPCPMTEAHLTTGYLQNSAASLIQKFEYPVDVLKPGSTEFNAEPTTLLLYRGLNHRVQVKRINGMTEQLLTSLDRTNTQPVIHTILALQAESAIDEETFLASAISMLKGLFNDGALYHCAGS